MIFNSVQFGFFFAVFMALFALVYRNIILRNALILGASYLFYGWWDVRFLILVALSTSIDFCAALGASGQRVTLSDRLRAAGFICAVALLAVLIAKRDYYLLGITVAGSALFVASHFVPMRLSAAGQRKAWLLLSLVVNFGVLFFFKYFNFFVDQMIALFDLAGLHVSPFSLRIVLPVGLSFFTFQATSRTIDSYLGRYTPANNLLNYAAFHAFFPQLVAGPIERAGHLMPQFETFRPINRDMVATGGMLFLWGLFKKVVVADNMTALVDPVFSGNSYTSAEALVAILGFTIQIYGDFSGYSDMARGIARVMGFELMRNFDVPYCARSPAEFWRRWHISLSQWLRDYIYIPLGGSRDGKAKTYRNLMATMLLGGIWHGASWTFVFWGAYHGAIQVIYQALGLNRLLEDKKEPLSAARVLTNLGFWALTMVLVMIGWVFFRAQTFGQAAGLLSAVFVWKGGPPDLSPILWLIWPLVLVEAAEIYRKRQDGYLDLKGFWRFNAVLACVLVVLLLAATNGAQFIYFDF